MRALVGWLLLASFLAGCGTYQLRGKVVAGEQSAVRVVDGDHPAFQRAGLKDVRVECVIDPQSLGKESLPVQRTTRKGWFTVPVDVFGAGVLLYDVEVVAKDGAHAPASRIFRLPPRNKRLLITLGDRRRILSDRGGGLRVRDRAVPPWPGEGP